MREYNIWQSSTRSILEYIIKEILYEIPYSISGGFAVQIYSYVNKDKSFRRNTKDIDILVLREYKEKLLDILKDKKIYYKLQKSVVRDSLDIIMEKGPKISISFVDNSPSYEKLNINKITVNVENLESLLVNKFSTYNFRTVDKDITDLCQVIKLLKKKEVNMDEIIRAMKRYNIVEDAEKIFFVFLELNGLIKSPEKYIDIDAEEKNNFSYYLKSKKLICKE
ncbi:MAG: hypothetical protein QXQ19_02135 [Candidatus Aenigmatarchaeota archaeon]